MLVAARTTWLIDALIDALGRADPDIVVSQLGEFVPPDVHVILAQSGIPDEHVFPLPVVLVERPTLVAYYRLLLGLPQKSFYGTGSGMGTFRSMERGAITSRQVAKLPAFCRAMSEALADLVRQMTPSMSRRDVAELPLLTLGQQLQGGRNNVIGQEATKSIFIAMIEMLRPRMTNATATTLTVQNDSGDAFVVTLAGDPDLRIQRVIADSSRRRGVDNIVAIEIKGGSDRSNQHNRIGEAEESHQKAKGEGFQDFWTIIRTKGLDMGVAATESPTTRLWFDTGQIGARQGPDWERFRASVLQAMNLSTDEEPSSL